MANPVVEALNASSFNFAAVGDSYDFQVRATDTDQVAGTRTETFNFEITDSAGNRVPITFTAQIPTLTPENLTWQEPASVPAGFTAVLMNHSPGNPATATYRITRTA